MLHFYIDHLSKQLKKKRKNREKKRRNIITISNTLTTSHLHKMIIGSAINKRSNHSNPTLLPNPSVKPPPINNQARGTGFALVKARKKSTVHPSNKIKLISSPTKKRIKPWNKQHLEIHLNTTKHVDVAQFQLSLKKGSVNSSAGNDDVPSTIASLSSNVICCVGASGIVSGTMNIGYLGLMPVRKRKKPKISDSMTIPLPEKVKKG